MLLLANLIILLIYAKLATGAIPTHTPTKAPVRAPTRSPTNTRKPTTYFPTSIPTITIVPTPSPSSIPTSLPTGQPTGQPTSSPTGQPTRQPTSRPTAIPTKVSDYPTSQPTSIPTGQPTSQPTSQPSSPHYTSSPSKRPTAQPTGQPTSRPTYPRTSKPTRTPTRSPTPRPTANPTLKPTRQPTLLPTPRPTTPTKKPSSRPTGQPSTYPTGQPSGQPTASPTVVPSSSVPTITHHPTGQPSSQPSSSPSSQPTSRPTGSPTLTHAPSARPTGQPTSRPSSQPSAQPTRQPTSQPTAQPSAPTGQPTSSPTGQPTAQPTRQPTAQPTGQPTRQPTGQPTGQPSKPTFPPTRSPTPASAFPTGQPTGQPTSKPTGRPTSFPTPVSFTDPTFVPTYAPTGQPTSRPTTQDETYTPTGYYYPANLTGSVTFHRSTPEICEEMEILIVLYFWKLISKGDAIRIYTPGLTSGNCKSPKNGVGVDDLFFNNNSFVSGRFVEGNYTKNYVDSYIELNVELEEGLSWDTYYSVRIDRNNGLKRSCSKNSTDWPVEIRRCNIFGLCDKYYQFGSLPVTNDYRPLQCFAYSSKLQILPGLQHKPAELNLTMFLAYPLATGDSIVITLPGFSNRFTHYTANRTGYMGDGFSGNLSVVRFNTSFSWYASWTEGNHTTQYKDSTLTLHTEGAISTYTDFAFNIFIPRYPNALASEYGRRPNYKGFTYEIVSSSGGFFTNKTTFDSVDAIGRGCLDLNRCNGHGECDISISKCNCYDGYGSANDLAVAVSNDFQADCSAQTCPLGYASGSVPSNGTGVHRLIECSNNGVCDRSLGACKCFTGYEGVACNRMSCPDKCTNRGVCLSMYQLARNRRALPLTNVYAIYSDTQQNITGAWDGSFGHACVCDSSWAVGLEANQTQQAEYFGAACEFRHCPTGDDPNTTDDETDCEGKSMTGGPVGLSGNKCHVDCSNRGKCDFETGVCKCYPGHYGHNCALRSVF